MARLGRPGAAPLLVVSKGIVQGTSANCRVLHEEEKERIKRKESERLKERREWDSRLAMTDAALCLRRSSYRDGDYPEVKRLVASSRKTGARTKHGKRIGLKWCTNTCLGP